MIDVTHRYGHAPVGQPAELIDPFIDGEHYSLVAALSKTGYLATHVVPGSLNSFSFDFILEDVVSYFPTGELSICVDHQTCYSSHR